MWRLIPLALIQSILLCGAQVMLKFALQRMPRFEWSREFWCSMLQNWQFAASGIFFVGASLLWMYIIKVFPFSQAYPMVSLSYVFGMVSAIFFFGEEVHAQQWVGVALIIAGCLLIAK